MDYPAVGISPEAHGSQARKAREKQSEAAHESLPAFSLLGAGYYNSITKIGGIPLVIPPLTDEDDLHRVPMAVI